MFSYLNSLLNTTEQDPLNIPTTPSDNQDGWIHVDPIDPVKLAKPVTLSYADAVNRNRCGHGAAPAIIKPVDWTPSVLRDLALDTDIAAESAWRSEVSKAYRLPEPDSVSTSSAPIYPELISLPDSVSGISIITDEWSIYSSGSWLDYESCYGLYYPWWDLHHYDEFSTRRDAFDYLLAGRNLDCIFKDFRSGAKARLRGRERMTKYLKHRPMKAREANALRNDIRARRDYWPKDSFPYRWEPTTKRIHYLLAQLRCRQPQFIPHIPGRAHFRYPACVSCIKRKNNRKHRQRGLRDLQHEGEDEQLQYLASGGNMNLFYRSFQVRLGRWLLDDNLDVLQQYSHRQEYRYLHADSWQHRVWECDAKPGETCHQHVMMDGGVLFAVAHALVDGERRLFCRAVEDNHGDVWPPTCTDHERREWATEVSLGDYLRCGGVGKLELEDVVNAGASDLMGCDGSAEDSGWVRYSQCATSSSDVNGSTSGSEWEIT